MAAIVVSNRQVSGSIAGQVIPTVHVKKHWADAWQYVPYAMPIQGDETVAPNIGRMSIRYDYGRNTREDRASYATETPLNFDNWYAAVWVSDRYGSAALWYGIIPSQDYAINDGSPAGGQMTITAFELSHILDRQVITGAYTDNGFIERPLKFNGKHGFGLTTQGNRGSLDPATNAYRFGPGNDQWSNAQIAAYLLSYYGPSSVNFVLTGELSALDAIVEEHNLDGLTVWAALNKLIDRRRGLGFRVVSAGAGTVYVYVFSVLSFPIAYGEGYLGPNAFATGVNFDNNPAWSPRLNVSSIDRYSKVIVRGGPVSCCFSVSYTDGTLTEGWETADTTAYEDVNQGSAEANDAERSTDKYKNVYQKHDLNMRS